jgi:glycosyltransferase involved in cell wall biosynthesis
LGAAIRSVVEQNYPDLEYIVVDGKSSDNSLKIIKDYSYCIYQWLSESDSGQFDAINKGFNLSSGEIMAWINSDDMYTWDALITVGEIFFSFPEIEWITSIRPLHINSAGKYRHCPSLTGFHKRGFQQGEYVVGKIPFKSGWIPQESTFWRRSIWERAGGKLDNSWVMAGDFELWTRFYDLTDLYGVDHPLGIFRHHPEQKTSLYLEKYKSEAETILMSKYGCKKKLINLFARNCVTKLPVFLRKPFNKIGLAYPSRIIIRDVHEQKWKIVDTYV